MEREDYPLRAQQGPRRRHQGLLCRCPYRHRRPILLRPARPVGGQKRGGRRGGDEASLILEQ